MRPADDPRVLSRLTALADRYGLPSAAPQQLFELLRLVQSSPHSLTAVREPAAGVDLHVADSLAGLGVAELAAARRIADLGSGGGFPGVVLAIALPDARVWLVESVGKKATFLHETTESLGLTNVEVVAARAESWPAGIGSCDAVTARAVAPLDVLLEYAAPLLSVGGALVAWKGRRDAREEADAATACAILGMEPPKALPTTGPDGAQRHLYLSRKVLPTPPGFPRREGMARKRSLGGSGRG